MTVKFVVAQLLAAGWLGVSIWLSLPWLRELAVAISMVAAIVVVSLVAYLPGWLVAFLAVSLLLDRQPPLRRTHPAAPVNRAGRRPQRGRLDPGDDLLHRRPGLPGARRGPGGRQRLHRRHPGGGRGLRRRHRQRVRCIEEPRPGKSHALNTGLAAVETELVITLDADTLLHPQAIRDNLWTRMQEWDYFLGIASVKRMQGLYQVMLVAQGAFSLYRTQALLQAGGWPDAIGEDIVLTWQLMRQGARVY